MSAESVQGKNFVQGTMTFLDATGTPITLVLALDHGNFSWDVIAEELNEEVIGQRRGKFAWLGRGERIFPAWSITAYCGNIVGATALTAGTPTEFVTKKGFYAANVSTLGASRKCTIDAKLTIEGTQWGDTADETVTFEDSVCKVAFQEAAEGNIITITGRTLGSVVVVNSTQTITYSQVA